MEVACGLFFCGKGDGMRRCYGLDIIWVIMRSVSLKILDLRMDSKDFS